MNPVLLSTLQFISDFVYLYPLFVSFIWIVGGLIFYWRLERKKVQTPMMKEYPFFSVLVPCHDEEDQIDETVLHLLNLDYPNYEIILIDDGSRDSTPEALKKISIEHESIRVIYFRENQGKASALNAGCAAAKGEFLLAMDADALLDRKALKWFAWHFSKYPRVGAITGNPRVINRTTLLGKIQTGEYATVIGLIKRTHRILGKILTVSGVIAAFRKQAIVSSGLWDPEMVTEDIDITWKLEMNFWDVRYEPRAICWIFVPETLRGLWCQRLRWAQGGVEVLRKHIGIWSRWKQRRLWPVYIEYMFSVFWAYSFWLLVILWAAQAVFMIFLPINLVPPIPPLWTGSILALLCLVQFIVSLSIDRQYDRKMLRYLFWVIWYPFVYWVINASTVVVALPKALLKKKGTKAVWTSPDRGLDKFSKLRKK